MSAKISQLPDGVAVEAGDLLFAARGAGNVKLDASVFATAAQGELAETALQNAAEFATASQGATADSALQPSGNGGSLTGLTKTQVGLSNVDNTSDASKPVSTATQTALDGKQVAGTYATGTGTASGTNTGDNATNTQYSGLAASKQDTLVSGTNIKTVNGDSVLGSGNLVVSGGAPTSTGNALATPTASQTDTITHGLGRTPIVIRIYGVGSFVSNAAATPTPFSMGIWNSSGNRCVYMTSAGTSSRTPQVSSVFSVFCATSSGNTISGVIQNVGATTFDIVWTETGTSVAQAYLWEAQ